jgi:hypothetical protein
MRLFLASCQKEVFQNRGTANESTSFLFADSKSKIILVFDTTVRVIKHKSP